MRLVDLEPRWIHHNVFAFLCPHCQDVYLTCKNVPMEMRDQMALFADAIPNNGGRVVPTRPEFSWTITGTVPDDPQAAFPTNLTVTPSIDASSSGHWHGHITNGEIVGGI